MSHHGDALGEGPQRVASLAPPALTRALLAPAGRVNYRIVGSALEDRMAKAALARPPRRASGARDVAPGAAA